MKSRGNDRGTSLQCQKLAGGAEDSKGMETRFSALHKPRDESVDFETMYSQGDHSTRYRKEMKFPVDDSQEIGEETTGCLY